ncbi:LytTR family transcriptional regulator DNA-binding domain-containing protein [Marinilongibacter aquaticus]|uniref:LytR/AlgR family response regulator transcription factor n=1 Tax=Marinilongibacter aquaticus TaxID=2975157 RepID=UPI0021BDEEC5|nr:LytTR family DNA-binding domain-containing protein [Marinilongibacter aquaticus]UBM60078.1 LytTR family transcriptional regulator DNA-binding domain-containing protein [Marinilongibacter aquaticus]
MPETIHLVGKKYVSPKQIVLLRADANYTEVVLASGEQIIVSKTLKEMEKSFNFPNFFRTHKSYMVNLEHIDSVQRNGIRNRITLKNNINADVSRRRKEAFFNALRQHAS